MEKREAAELLKDFRSNAKRFASNPWNQILAEWSGRKRVTGKYEASHPVTLRALVTDLDARGEIRAADAIQSLVWELAINQNRSISDVLANIELTLMQMAGEFEPKDGE